MTGPLLYPGADHTTQWVGKGSVLMPMTHVKWVVHTTETAGGWPSYYYGGYTMGSAPTFTYEPWQHKWRQHFEVNQSARALESPGSSVINRLDVVQTEISCYCDHSLSAKYGHSCTALDQQAIDDLGQFGAWLVSEWGMKADSFYPASLPWATYPGGCTRMSYDAYKSFSGVLGHMAVPYNSHLDPGDLPLDRIKARMDDLASGPGKQPPSHPLADAWQRATGDVSRALDKAIAAGEAYTKEHPAEKVLVTDLAQQRAARTNTTRHWSDIHNRNPE